MNVTSYATIFIFLILSIIAWLRPWNVWVLAQNGMGYGVWESYGFWGQFFQEQAWWIRKSMGYNRVWGLTVMGYYRVDCTGLRVLQVTSLRSALSLFNIARTKRKQKHFGNKVHRMSRSECTRDVYRHAQQYPRLQFKPIIASKVCKALFNLASQSVNNLIMLIRIQLTQCNKIAAIKSGHGSVIDTWPLRLSAALNRITEDCL